MWKRRKARSLLVLIAQLALFGFSFGRQLPYVVINPPKIGDLIPTFRGAVRKDVVTPYCVSRRSGLCRPGGHSEGSAPDPIPNSDVKPLCADGIALRKCVRVGRCQACKSRSNSKPKLCNLDLTMLIHAPFGATGAQASHTSSTGYRGVEQSGSSSGS